jgi:hypothetical protein
VQVYSEDFVLRKIFGAVQKNIPAASWSAARESIYSEAMQRGIGTK